MPYRLLEHTADLALEVEAEELGALFAEALRGLTDCLTEVERVGGGSRRRLRLEASELDRLLVAWLDNAVFLFEVEGLVLGDAEVEIGGGPGAWRLAAELSGEPFDERRHPLKVPIKGVTYHRLLIEEHAGGWRARVIFDI